MSRLNGLFVAAASGPEVLDRLYFSFSSRFMMETQKLLGCRTVPVNGPAMCLRDETDEAATDCVVI